MGFKGGKMGEGMNESTKPKITTETIILEKIKKAAIAHFTKEMIDDLSLDFSSHINFMAETYVFRVIKELLAFKAGDRIVRYPENWKEAFKERWFPAWLKKRFPVKYTEHDVLVVFPDLLKKHPCPQSLSDQNYHIVFAKHPFLPSDDKGEKNE